jgi:plastocyanin
MSNRLWLRLVAAALLLLAASLAGTAVAASKKAPNKATITIKSPVKYKTNKFIQDGSRYIPGKVAIKSGGKLTLKNKSVQPHTFSIVQKKDLPKNLKQIFNCGAPGTICETIFTAFAPDPDGNPTKPVVDVGSPGIDQAGDELSLNPKSTTKVDVSAKKGTTLYFMCGIHAWMQGSLKVR